MSISPRKRFSVSLLSQGLDQYSDTGLLDIRYFLAEILQCPVSEVFLDVFLTVDQHEVLEGMIGRRVSGEPVAYILGHCVFWGLFLKVNRFVLIPRSDTECLVETVLKRHSNQSLKIFDMGTGSGAIALALAHERSKWHVQGMDISSQAISLARENAKIHKLNSSRVYFFEGTWENKSIFTGKSVDIVVANPPYIARKSTDVCSNVVRFEPDKALFSSKNGMQDLTKIAKLSLSFLANNGWLYLEHGFDQGSSVRQMLSGLGYLHVQTVCDYTGAERVTFGQKRVLKVET